MAKRTLENLQKQYNSSAASDSRKGPPMPGPGGRRGGPGGPRGMGGKPKGNAKKVVARLLSYIGAYKYLLVLAFVFLILSTLAGTAASYLLRPIVNAMVDTARTLDERLAYVVRVVVMLLIVYGVQVMMQYAQFSGNTFPVSS